MGGKFGKQNISSMAYSKSVILYSDVWNYKF